MFKIAFERWKLFGVILGDANGVVFSFLFYFTIMIPFGIGMRLLGDPLAVKDKTPVWVAREPISAQLQDARRQG